MSTRSAGGKYWPEVYPAGKRAEARTTNRHCLAAASRLGFAVILMVVAQASGGENGTIHSGAAAGLRVKVDTRWLDGGGYRPVKITVTPAPATPVDRTLVVECLVSRWYGRRSTCDLRVMRTIEIPAGTASVETTLLVPQTAGWIQYTINFVEDGQLLRPLVFTNSPNSSYNWQSGEEAFSRVLIVGGQLPDTTKLTSAWPLQRYMDSGVYSAAVQPGTTNSPVPPTMPLPTAISRSLSELPSQWLEYTNLDVVCLRLDELAELSQKHPEAFQAVCRWTAAGGNLWVYDVGDQWKNLPQLERLLQFDLPSSGVRREPASRGWTEPDPGVFRQPLQGIGNSAYDNSGDVYRTPSEASTVPAEPEPPPNPPERSPFVVRTYGLGQVAALESSNPWPGDKHQWRWLLNTTGSSRCLWYQRHGLSPIRENADFWNFLIPGIGLAPVTAFIVLISLFVVIIGPVNYLLLRRWKRLHLLLLTTPAAAALVTLALFGYAMVADGLATRLRVRSVTQLDQRRGQAVCWARLSYYAGLAPSGGLKFASDIAVIPLEYLPGESASSLRELQWEGQQLMTGGWLMSRRPTQFLTMRSRESQRRLDLREPAEPAGTAELTNRLGTRIEQLLVQGKNGKYYWAAGVDNGAKVRVQPVEHAVAMQRLRKTFVENQPQFLPGLDRQTVSNSYSSFRSAYYWYSNRTDLPAPAQATGLLETALAAPTAISSSGEEALRPGSYVAVVEQSPEVDLGYAKARLQAGFHVILGRW
jgi:hypothetical protein